MKLNEHMMEEMRPGREIGCVCVVLLSDGERGKELAKELLDARLSLQMIGGYSGC